jgi:hypothetical protein
MKSSLFAFVCLFAFGHTFSHGWEGEPPGQEYSLKAGDRVLFWVPDEMPPQYGEAFLVWGYVPAIWRDNGGGTLFFWRGHRAARVRWVKGET